MRLGQTTSSTLTLRLRCSFGRAYNAMTDADKRSFEVRELEMGTDYIVRVGAVNINGTGDMSAWIEVHTSDSELDGV